MLVGDDLHESLAERFDLGAGGLGVLDADEAEGDEHALAHVVDGVVEHGLEDGDGLLVAGAGARDAQGHGGAVSDVGVVALGEQGNDAWTLLWGSLIIIIITIIIIILFYIFKIFLFKIFFGSGYF